MTDQEINVAIANALGVKADPNPDREGKPCPICDATGKRRYGRECLRCHGTGKLSVRVRRCPDYCNDLNAMHEAFESLSDCLKYDATEYLIDAVKANRNKLCCRPVQVNWIDRVSELLKIQNATARQRAEAFLKTIGGWKE